MCTLSIGSCRAETSTPSSDAATATHLLTYQTANEPFESPSWWDVTRLLSDTVTEHPDDGLALLEAFGAEPTIVGAPGTFYDLPDLDAKRTQLNGRLSSKVQHDLDEQAIRFRLAG